jgi:GxxExxY protein
MMKNYETIPQETEAIVTRAIDCAMQVHRNLGPGFKEVIYQRAYCLELNAQGILFRSEVPIAVKYKTWEIPGQKVDLLIQGTVLVELKAVPKVRRLHRCQVVSYLRTLDLRLGLILNFNTELMRDGIHRVVR